MKFCKVCGRKIEEEREVIKIVNEGMDSEFCLCESCACRRANDYVVCENCGGWFTTDVIHDEVLSQYVTFTPCPICCKDIVDCMTREEMMGEVIVNRYSVVVTFANGYHRGYVVIADDADNMMQKLMDHIRKQTGLGGIHSITVSEILLEEDVIK